MGKIDNFGLDIPIEETQWLVDRLVPMGHLSLVIAQAGVGKSYLVEQLAVCVIFGEPFLGLTVTGGSVLIIDEDTPERALYRRLQKFMMQYKDKQPKGELRVRSMAGMKLSGSSLMAEIIDNDDVVLVIIDSLNAVCGDLDPNSTRSMSCLQKLKQTCLKSTMTIMINQKKKKKARRSAHDLMTCDPHELAMGSSVINQQADSYYVLSAPESGNGLKSLFVRPVGKREMLQVEPFKAKYNEENGTAYFEELEKLNLTKDLLADIERDIMTIYRELDQGRNVGRTVQEIHDAMHGAHGIQPVREALKQLEIKGELRMRRSKHNLFHYEIVPGKEEWPSPVEDEEEAVENQ